MMLFYRIVHIFDPTPRAIEHVKYVKDVLENKQKPIDNKKYGGGDPNYWKIILSHKAKGDNINYIRDKIYPTYLSVDFDLMRYNQCRWKEIILKLFENDYKLIKATGQDFSFCRGIEF